MNLFFKEGVRWVIKFWITLVPWGLIPISKKLVVIVEIISLKFCSDKYENNFWIR